MLSNYLKKIKSKQFKAILVTLFLRVLGVVTLFGFSLFLTNNYSSEIVGNYELIRVFVLVISCVGILGIDQSIYQFVGKLKAENAFENSLYQLYMQIIKLLIISSIIIIGLFYLIPKQWILNFYSDDELIYNYIEKSILLLIFYSLTIVNTEILRGLNLINISELFRNFLKFTPVILGSILLLSIGEPIFIIDFYLYGFVLLSIISTVVVLNRIKLIQKSNVVSNQFITFSKSEIAVLSYPMAISGFCFFVMLSVDVFLLKRYFSNSHVAYYSIAVKFLTILSLVIVAINVNISPKIAEHYFSSNKKELLSLLSKSRMMICLINWTTGIFLIGLGKILLGFFGEEYVQAYQPMVILVFGQMIASLFGSVAVALNMIGKQIIFQRILVVSTVINIVSNVIFIPKYGMNGAAISFVMSLLFWNLISSLYLNKHLQSKFTTP